MRHHDKNALGTNSDVHGAAHITARPTAKFPVGEISVCGDLEGTKDRGIEAAAASLSATVKTLAEDLDEKIKGTAQLHYGLARARDLDTRDRVACSAFLSAVREEYPQYTGILTIDPDGSLFCDSLQTGRDLDLNRTYKTLRIADPDGRLLALDDRVPLMADG